MLTSDISQTDRFLGGSVLRLQPLSKQRRGLALDVQCQLLANEGECLLFNRSTLKHVQVIPATELRDVLQVTQNRFGILGSQVAHGDAEETTLTLSTAYVSNIEQALQGIHRVLLESLTEHQNNIRLRTSTIGSTHRKHIEQIRLGSLVGQSTILSVGEIGSIRQTIHESIHSSFSFSH